MARSAGVVTSAAAVMVAVFAIFGTLSTLEMKQLGVGLATAVLLDATLVRGVLLPAVLALLGRRAHTGPRWIPDPAPLTDHGPSSTLPVIKESVGTSCRQSGTECPRIP